jgi:AsmA protein
MPRRIVLLIAVLTLALLATAVAPWTLSGGGVRATIAKHLRDGYGVDLEVRGRSTLALLPVPRVKFEDVTLSSVDKTLVAEGGTVRGELRLLPLLVGRVELSDLSLSGSRVRIEGDWTPWLKGLTAPDSAATLRRVVIMGTSLRGPTAGGIEDVNVVINWPGGDARLDMAGSLSWRGERMQVAQASLTPASLLAGAPSPFALNLSAAAAQFAVEGELQSGPEVRVHGTSRIDIRSVRDFARWTGIELPLSSLVPAIGIEGPFSADRRHLSWPTVALTLGSDRLDGTLALRFNGGRPALTGTLAADQLNLSDVLAPFLQSRTAAGWSGEPVSLASVTGGDLDLRLSAAEASVGRVTLNDVAASVLVRPGRVEATVGRAGLNAGTVKGRLTVASLEGLTEMKAQGTFDKVDVGPFLAGLGRSRWLTGQASGQVHLDGAGLTVADMVRQTSGRTSLTVRQGELVGVGLNEVLKRLDKRPLAAVMEWRGGRTPFDVAQMNLAVSGGVGEVTDATLTSPTLRTALSGRISLVDGAVALRAHVDPAQSPSPSPLLVFDLTGGFDDIAVIPDAKAAIERSGAAKPLFGERLAPGARAPSPPVATAH